MATSINGLSIHVGSSQDIDNVRWAPERTVDYGGALASLVIPGVVIASLGVANLHLTTEAAEALAARLMDAVAVARQSDPA